MGLALGALPQLVKEKSYIDLEHKDICNSDCCRKDLQACKSHASWARRPNSGKSIGDPLSAALLTLRKLLGVLPANEVQQRAAYAIHPE